MKRWIYLAVLLPIVSTLFAGCAPDENPVQKADEQQKQVTSRSNMKQRAMQRQGATKPN